MRVHTEYSTSSSASDNDHLAAPRQGSKVSLVRTVGHISDFTVKKNNASVVLSDSNARWVDSQEEETEAP